MANRFRRDLGAAHGVERQGMEVQIVVDRQDGVDRLAVHALVGLDSRAGQLAQRAVDIDVMRCSVILDDRGDGGVLLGAQVLDLSVGQIIGAVGQLLDVEHIVADIDVADRGGRQFKLGVDGLVCFQNRCEVILLGEFGVGIPANERVLVLGRVSGSCNCIAVADRDRVDGGAAVGFEGQGMLVEIILDIDRQTLFDLDVLLRVSVVGRIVRAVVLRSHSCERFKLAAQRFDLSVFLVIGAVGQLLDVADGVVVGVGRIGERENLVVFIKDHRLAGCVRRVADHVCGLLGHFGVERLIGHDLFRRENLIVAFTQVFDRVAHVGLCRVAPVEFPLLGYGQSVQLVTGGADILFGFIPAVEVITGLFAGRQDACAGFKLADIERSAVDLVVVLIEVVEMDRPVPVCRDNAVASRASGDLGDLLADLVVPLKERLAPVSAGRIGQRDGIALNRVRRGVGAGGLAVVVYILNGVLNGRKFAVELPFLGHVQLFDLSFYANISCFLIPAAEFVTIFCIRSPQAVGGIVNRVNRVHLLFYPRTGFIREVVLDCERLLLPLCGEDHAALGDGVGVASLEERFIGRIVCAVSVKVVGIIFSRNDFNAPALEAITFAGRLSGGQGDGVASEVEVVEVDRAVVIGVVDSGHILDVLSTGSERNGCEVQIAGELVAVICRIAGRHVLFVYGLVQDSPCDLFSGILENTGFERDALRQLCKGCGQFRIVAEVQIARQRHCIEIKAADGNVAEAVVAAEAETGQGRSVQRDRLIELARGQRCKIAVQSCIRVDVVRGDMPLRRQGDVLLNSSGEVILFIAQIPAVEGIAGLLGSSRLGRGEAVFHFLRGRNGRAAVGIKGDGIYLCHKHAALSLDLPAVPGPDQCDRNDLLIVLDMFRGRERLVERGHIAVGEIADVAKPVVPVLPRLADEVVFIVLAEQAVGVRMLLRSIYNALDLNSHVKLFQLVSRRGFGLADDFNDRQVTLLLPFPVPVNSYFGVIAEGDGQRCVLLVNEPMLDAGGGVICHQIRRYRDRRGDVVALLVLLHIADRILRRGGNIIRLVSMCCFVVLADDSKAAVQRRGLCGRGHFVRGFDPRVRCRFHPRLTIFIIGEVERDGLRGRGVLHLPDQIAGLLHEPCRPDSHRADISARAIAYDLADRMLCVGRVSEQILYRIMRSGCRNADNIYNNAGHVVFRGLGGLVGGWGVRLPDGVESGGRGGCCNPITRLDGGRCCVRFPIPAEEVVAFSGRNRAGNGERHRAGAALLRHRVGDWHVGDEIRRVGVVDQGVGDGGGNSLLRNQVNRIRCLRSSRTGGVEVNNCGVLLGLFRPANEFIARIQLAFQRRNADISELADQNRMIEARMACAILACIGLINRHAIVIASVELIANIKNLVLDCLCFIRFQRLRTDTVVSRKG